MIGSLIAIAILLGAVLYVSSGRGDQGAPIGVLRTADYHALAFSPVDPEVAFFGHHNGLMRTSDGGRTWTAVVDRPNFDAMALAVGGGENQPRVYVAGHDIFQVSDDGGATWQAVPHDLPGTDIHGFAMSPTDSSHLYAFVVGHGLFASTDGGRNWQRAGRQLPNDVMSLAVAGGSPEMVYAASMSRGVLRSADGGRSWQGVNGPAAIVVATDPTAPETIYAGAADGTYRSVDRGDSWQGLSFPGVNVVALAVSPAQPDVLLAISVAGPEGHVFRSEDGGHTWRQPQ